MKKEKKPATKAAEVPRPPSAKANAAYSICFLAWAFRDTEDGNPWVHVIAGDLEDAIRKARLVYPRFATCKVFKVEKLVVVS